MADPPAKRARVRASPLLTELPPELNKHMYGFLDFQDQQALSRTNKTMKASIQDATGFDSIKEQTALQALAKRLTNSPQGILPALLDRLKNTTYPNRRMVGVKLGPRHASKDQTRRALKEAVKFHVDQLAPDAGAKDTVMAQLLLNVLDAVLFPVSPPNAPDVQFRPLSKLKVLPNFKSNLRQLSPDDGYEAYTFSQEYQTLNGLSFKASGFKRSITIDTVTFEGDHPKMYQRREEGWGLARRLREMAECTNWRRTGDDSSYYSTIASLLLKSGMFHMRGSDILYDDRQMFVSSGFADACAAGY
jgi:hypothetical protein